MPESNDPAAVDGTPPGFGPLLRRFRKRRKLSQEGLAERASCNHHTVSRLESGVQAPYRDQVVQLAHGLDLEPQEEAQLLLAGGFTIDWIEKSLSEPEVRDFLNAFGNSSLPEGQREVIRLTLADVAQKARALAQHGKR